MTVLRVIDFNETASGYGKSFRGSFMSLDFSHF